MTEELYELAGELGKIFDEFGAEHFLIGGLAVKKYDDYRETYDVDLIAAPIRIEAGVDRRVARELADRLWSWTESRDFHITTMKRGRRLPVSEVTKEMIENALWHGNRLLEFWREGKKIIDVIVGKAIPKEDYEESYRVIDGMNVAVPEYLIANKLWLIKVGKARASDRSDVLRLLAYVELDEERLERYARKMTVSALLKKFERKVDEARGFVPTLEGV